MPIGWMTLVIAVVLYVAGSNIGSGWVIILTAAMTGAVLIDLLTVWRSARRTRLTVTLPAAATTLQPPTVEVIVRRPDLGAVLHVSDVEGTVRGVVRGAVAHLSAPVPAGRGHHTLARVRARTIGPLGLAHVTGEEGHAVDLWVRPTILPADGRVRALVAHAGEEAGAARDAGQEEVRGVRGFEPGDPRRSVHWRATARHGALMVRQSEAPRGSQVTITLEGGVWPQARLDLAAVVAASLCDTGVRLGHRVELAVDGTTAGWDDQAHHRLAGLPPAVGVAPRSLVHAGQEGVRIAPADEGVLVDDGTSRPVHLTDLEEARRWLADR